MVIDFTPSKGQPRLIPSGASPTFAADVSDISTWLAAGRTFRRAATQAALYALSGMDDNDLGIVDNIDGAFFRYDGGAGSWKMYGEPVFATLGALTTAITVPVTGMRAIVAGLPVRYNGTAWTGGGSGLIPITPASVVGGTINADGTVSFTAAASVSLNGIFTAEFKRYKLMLDIGTAAAANITAKLRAAGADSSTNYDESYNYNGASTNPTQNFNATALALVAASSTGIEFSAETDFFNPFLASPTRWLNLQGFKFISTSSVVSFSGGGRHRLSTSYDGLTILPSASTITGELQVFGYGNS